MFRGSFLTRILVTILLFGLLAAAGFGLVRLGWSQGYTAGLLAEGAEFAQPYFGPRYWGPGFFGGGLFLLFGVGLFFFFGMFVLRILFFGRHMRAWKRAGGTPPEGWGEHWGKWGRGPYGPWREGPPGSQPEEPEAKGSPNDSPIKEA
jgi:hypothetical protein